MMSHDLPKESDFLEYAMQHGFGDLHFKVDDATGMVAIIAIHSTKLGPALGGCRFIQYSNTTSAINDAMRLAMGMSYKAAALDLPLGGGKAVIIKPSKPFDREAYFHAFGKFVQELHGRYITALDSGTTLEDMDIISHHTKHVASLSNAKGDPSPSTAVGVFIGIQSAVKFKLGRDNLDGIHVAIQGLGHVGYDLAKLLYATGADLTVADVNKDVVLKAQTEFGAKVATPEQIHTVPCDIFSPCALGAIINDDSISQLQTKIIAGAANNQLAHQYHAKMLHDKGILYAPDYIINGGGLVFAASKYLHTPDSIVQKQIDNIGKSLDEIFERSAKENCPTSEIANKLVQEKLS